MIEFFARHQTAANLLMLLFLAVGITSLPTLKRETFPDFTLLLVEFLKLQVQEGIGVADAARKASRERFRALLLTSVSTIAGLLPLLSKRSLQAQVLIPLATSIVFGLLASTVLVLFVVPALFSVFSDLRMTSAEKIREEIDNRPRHPQAIPKPWKGTS